MPAYSFEALDAEGETRRGVMEADTAKAVRSLLRAQSLVPLQVAPVSSGVAANDQSLRWSDRAFSRGVFDSTGLAIWTRQLAGLVGSGLPLERALTALTEEAEEERERHLVAWRASRASSPTSTSPWSAPANRRATSAWCWSAWPTTSRSARR